MMRSLVRPPRLVAAPLLLLLVARGAAAQDPSAPATAPTAAPAAPAQTPPQQLKFAYLDSRQVLAATPGRAEAESLFAREMQGYRAEVTRRQAALDSAVQDYNRTSAAMTPAARAAREQQLRDMDQQTRQRAQELDQQAQQREQELTAPIMQRVQAVIEGIRAEQNYSFIFDVAAQSNPIVTADRSLDITQLVIQRIQAGGGAPPPTGPVLPGGQPPLAAPRDTTRPAGPVLRPRPSRP